MKKMFVFSNTKIFNLIKCVSFFVLFFVINKAGLNGLIYPFSFGLYFSLLWCNQNIFMVSFSCICGGYLATFDNVALISNILMCVIFLIFYCVHYKVKKPFNILNILIYACICNIPKIVLQLCLNNQNIYIIFVELLLGLLYTFTCLKCFECLCVRGLTGKLTSSEVICLMIFIGSIFCGLCSFKIYYVNLVVFFAVLLLLVASYVCNTTASLLLGISMAVGTLLFDNNPTMFSIFVLYSICSVIFKTKNKYISVASIIAIDCLCGFYINLYPNYSPFSLIPLLLACLIYILIPNKFLDKFCNQFLENISSLTHQTIINRNRELLYYKLVELSVVFSEMNKVFRGMIGGGFLDSDAKRLLLSEVKNKNCSDCPNHNKCYRVFNIETNNALEIMVESGFTKGKVNLLDVPTVFAGKCEKLNSLVSSINDLLDQYKNYAGLINNIDASKVLLAEQLGGVSNIMKELSLEINKGVKFEKGKEKRIIDELTYNNIICSDALVFQDNENIVSVALAVRKKDLNFVNIEKIVSKVCGHKLEIVDDKSSSRAGWQVLTLKTSPKYDLVFGVATRTKTGSTKSGDSFSVIKIKDGKYLFAICDGMGSGERAEQTSSTALGLLENFYKAGFEREIIISSVNKLLSLGKDDVFSALDLCVVDTRSGVGDFIKMGAPESFVKHKETTEKIKIGALPLGIIQNAESKAKEVYFTSGDKIILVSDGITDSFKDIEELQDFINNIESYNPQNIADQIIQKVLNKNNNIARDDMTVIVAKIFEK